MLGLDPGDRAAARALRERVGLVLQDIAVEPYLTVRETVARNAGYYPAPRGRRRGHRPGRPRRPERSRRCGTLSGGQQRRLDLALGMIGDPEAAVPGRADHRLRPERPPRRVAIVRDPARCAGTTIVLTTHYMDEAQALADRVAVIAAARSSPQGTPAALGGRDTARARIRSAAAAELPLGDLPLAPSAGVLSVRRPRHRGDHRADPDGCTGSPAGRCGRGAALDRPPWTGPAGGRLPAADRRGPGAARALRAAERRGSTDDRHHPAAPARRRNDLALLGHQICYEQLSFWRNPQSAFFTFVFPVVIIVLFGALFGHGCGELVLLRPAGAAVLRADDRRGIGAGPCYSQLAVCSLCAGKTASSNGFTPRRCRHGPISLGLLAHCVMVSIVDVALISAPAVSAACRCTDALGGDRVHACSSRGQLQRAGRSVASLVRNAEAAPPVAHSCCSRWCSYPVPISRFTPPC